MIVHLSHAPPDGPARTFVFQRDRITLGAGSRCDIVVPSAEAAVVIATLVASPSGVRVEPEPGTAEAVQFVAPGDPTPRPVEPSLLLPPATTLLIGDPAHRISIDRVVRAERVAFRSLGGLVQISAAEVAAELDEARRVAALRLAYLVAAADDPASVASELRDFIGRDRVAAVSVVFPADGAVAWDAPRAYGDASTPAPLAQLGLDAGELHTALCKGELVECRRGAAAVLFAPVTVGIRLRALIALNVDAPDDALGWLRPAIAAAVPLVLAIATRFGRAAELEAVEEENRYFRERQRRHYLFKDLVTESVPMRRLHRALGELVGSAAPVLLTGEAGTGKELLARALHHLGPRASGLLVSQSCAAGGDEVVELELFGLGSSTGGFSAAARRGAFELGDGGTVFLDDVHALPAKLQARLLRVMTEGELFRTGEPLARRVDVRVVAATHLDLMQLADEGRFRRDLAIALTRHTLHVPALRDRREDIAPLVAVFVEGFARRYRRRVTAVEPDVIAWLQRLPWPGNVRELSMMVERAVLAAPDDRESLVRRDFELG